MKAEDYFSRGLAIPSYDISKYEFTFRFKREQHTLKQGAAGFDYWRLDDGADGFKVLPIEKVREYAKAQNG